MKPLDRSSLVDRSRASLLRSFLLFLAAGHSLFAQELSISQMLHQSWLGRDGAPQEINALAQTAQELSISQMLHKSWLGRDGAPQEINALAQTPDGTLWIGSTGGLFSFDGIAFTQFQSPPGEPRLPSNAIDSLVVSQSGDLWVGGTYVGSAVRISKGHVTIYDTVEGRHADKLNALQQDASGTMWATVDNDQIVRLGQDGIWHFVANPIQGPGFITALFVDSSLTRWVAENGILYGTTKDGAQIRPLPVAVIDFNRFREDVDHSLWFPGNHVDSLGHPLSTLIRNQLVQDVLRLPNGDVWAAPYGSGLVRVPHGIYRGIALSESLSELDKYAQKDGLSSQEIRALLLDADGSIWAGGSRGLDRFVIPALVPAVGNAEQGNWSTCTNPQGEIWLADPRGAVSVIRKGQRKLVFSARAPIKLLCGRRGNVWLLDDSGIVDFTEGRPHRLPPPAERIVHSTGWNFVALLELADHELLASEAAPNVRDLWIYKNGRWQKFPKNIEAGFVTAMVQGDAGELFLGRTDGRISVLEENTIRTLSTTPFAIGVIATLSKTSRNVFALGLNGIAVYQRGVFRMLSFQEPQLAYTVSGLAESSDGDVWINGARGIIHIPSGEMKSALADPAHKILAEEIHEGDFVGPANFWEPNPSAVRDTRGQLWFATQDGVVSLDPEKLRQPTRLPHLSIQNVMVDGHPIQEGVALPSSVRTLEFRYLGINLKNPERVVYRYRLIGLDASWQDAGARPFAIYNHLKPDRYQFQVMASNGDGRWTAPATTSPFQISPSFYQTWWFTLLCVLAALLLVWLALIMRVRVVVRAHRLRAEERADERVRIARDLHDTLLQGVQGLLLSFHVAAQRVPAEDGSRNLLEKVLATADQIIIKGRNRVNSLRSEHLTDGELVASLERLCSDLNSGGQVQYNVRRSGIAATLAPPVVEEIFYIAREAVTNAFRHSAGSEIHLELQYGRRSFQMSCRDNGRGLDATIQREGGLRGHWGFRGMAERTETIGGHFSYRSAPDEGTNILVRVPGYRAYGQTHGIRSLLTGLL
jgi:signal transduction histidine kinase/ligand-binding sensor domain-containing protein